METESVYLISIFILIAIAMVSPYILFKKMIKIVSQKHDFNLPKQMVANKRSDLVVNETRVLTGADRVTVIRFHNGSEFLPNNPIWRITSGSQMKADGVSYEDIQDVLVSRIPAIIDPVITGETDYDGVSIPESCKKCIRKLCLERSARTVKFKVSDMTGYSKMFLQKRGTETAYMATLNSTKGKIFGLLLVEFSDKRDSLKEEEKIVKIICESTEKLSFMFD